METQDYADAVRDERILNRIKAEVRKLPEAEASAKALEIYAANRRVGLRVANACSRDKALFRNIFLRGLSEADPSTIRGWLKCVVPRIGIVAIVNLVASSNCSSLLAEACIYWIESMRVQPSRREASAMNHLKTILADAAGGHSPS